jgi:hypothetical protein
LEKGRQIRGAPPPPLGEEERDVAYVGQERRRLVAAGSGRDDMRRVRQMRRVTCAVTAPCRRTCRGVCRWPRSLRDSVLPLLHLGPRRRHRRAGGRKLKGPSRGEIEEEGSGKGSVNGVVSSREIAEPPPPLAGARAAAKPKMHAPLTAIPCRAISEPTATKPEMRA